MTASNERLLELLADRAVVGLGSREQIELAELLVKAQDVDAGAFDKAAAAIALASVGKLEKMPLGLAARVEQAALDALDSAGSIGPRRPASDYMRTRELDKLAPMFGTTQVDPLVMLPDSVQLVAEPPDFKRTHAMEDRPASASAAAAPESIATLVRPEDPPLRAIGPSGAAYRPPSNPQLPPGHPYGPMSTQPPSNVSNVVPFSSVQKAPRGPSRVVAISGWVAAAACLLLAIGVLARRAPPAPVVSLPLPPPTQTIATPTPTPTPVPVPTTVASVTPTELREKLLANESSARAEWSPTKDPLGKAATGEIVWNTELQKGTMRFKGLAKNDPSRAQYQLWIFDKSRDDKYPVDGGVFDVDTESGDVVVPIRATLAVNEPTLFAVTLEKPGGVVVSKRERIVVTAKMPAG